MRLLPFVSAAGLILLSACRSTPPPPVDPLNRAALLRYDANKDGVLTRAELDAGLAPEFAAADSNHDGKLDTAEITAVNEARWKSDGSRTSPLQDWNLDGIIDEREFGTEMRSLFDLIDLNHDGVISKEEFSPPQQERSGSRAGRGPGGPGRGR